MAHESNDIYNSKWFPWFLPVRSIIYIARMAHLVVTATNTLIFQGLAGRFLKVFEIQRPKYWFLKVWGLKILIFHGSKHWSCLLLQKNNDFPAALKPYSCSRAAEKQLEKHSLSCHLHTLQLFPRCRKTKISCRLQTLQLFSRCRKTTIFKVLHTLSKRWVLSLFYRFVAQFWIIFITFSHTFWLQCSSYFLMVF